MLFEELVWLEDAEPHTAALNMAVDEVLLRTITTPLLRTYRWARPAVSFGYFGRSEEVLREWPERDCVRRWTGGGVVLHGEDFTYSLLVPRAHAFAAVPAETSYERVHAVIVSLLGPGVSLAAERAVQRSDSCFENPVRHDLIADGEKIAGAAQRRTRTGLLHQGSVQLRAPRPDLAEALARALASHFEKISLSTAVANEAADVAASRYGTDAWLRRW